MNSPRVWPAEGVARVPYWVYQDDALYREEQARIFRGKTWNFLCLEAELPGPETFVTSDVGEMPVIVTRDASGSVHAFENRCAHRGALLCLKARGKASEFACVYHNWTHDLAGNLIGVAFRRGLKGEGGMPDDFRLDAQGPRKLRVEIFHGLVFGTLSPDTPSVETYLGPDVSRHLRRVMKAPVKVLGAYSQVLPSNWKLYMENTKDTYHASLLHLFFTKFRLNRLSQKGGVVVDESGGNHVSYTTMIGAQSGNEYEQAGLRSAQGEYTLEAPELLESVDEFGDGIVLQILGVFPGLVLQQIRNSLAVRRIVPQGLTQTELIWTVFGFATDDEQMTERRVRQGNLIGPAGYISLEDGAATGFVQRGSRAADGELAVVEMGGRDVRSQESRVSETSVRGFWKAYRARMAL